MILTPEVVDRLVSVDGTATFITRDGYRTRAHNPHAAKRILDRADQAGITYRVYGLVIYLVQSN